MAPTTVADSTKDVDRPKSSQRKINKPLIEKRRRARINDCLTQLKTIVLGSSEPQPGRSSKLEKADILEMTVEFVKSRLNSASGSVEQKPLSGDTSTKCDANYVAGYSKCLSEISRFLEQSLTNNTTLKEEIVQHMSDKLNSSIVPNLSGVDTSNNNKVCHMTQVNSVTSDCNEVMDLRTSLPEKSSEKNAEELCSPNGIQTDTKTSAQQPTVLGQTLHYSQPIGWLCGGQVMLMVPCAPSLAHIKQPEAFRQILPVTNHINVAENAHGVLVHPTQNAPFHSIYNSERAHGVLAYPTKNAPSQSISNSERAQGLLVYPTLTVPSFSNTNSQMNIMMQRQTAHAQSMDTTEHWRPW